MKSKTTLKVIKLIEDIISELSNKEYYTMEQNDDFIYLNKKFVISIEDIRNYFTDIDFYTTKNLRTDILKVSIRGKIITSIEYNKFSITEKIAKDGDYKRITKQIFQKLFWMFKSIDLDFYEQYQFEEDFRKFKLKKLIKSV